MGRRVAVIAVYQGEPGYFGTAPDLDTDRSARLAGRLPLRLTGPGSPGPLDPWPSASAAGVGAYARGALVVHRSLLDASMRADEHPVGQALLQEYPGASLVAVGLHSVVSCFGYTVAERGRVRRFGGAEDHLDEESGELLPEEEGHFARSTRRDGMRYFTSPEFPGEELDAPAYGEELVMSVTTRLFGRPLDQLATAPVAIAYFRRRPWWQVW